MNYEYMRLEVDDRVARLTFCRPERANAINLAFATEMLHVAQTCRDRDDIRVVVMAAEGKLFCAGGDIHSFAEAGDQLPEALAALAGKLHEALEVLDAMPKPVIAEVNGVAAGAGLSLVACTSLAYATTASKFTMAYTGIGLTPDGSSSWHLPRLVGWRRAEELILTNRVLSAREAADWGLINACYEEREGLEDAVAKLARTLADGPTRAYGTARRLLMASAGRSLHEQLAMETQEIVGSARSADGREGIAAFLSKRKPEFSGQ